MPSSDWKSHILAAAEQLDRHFGLEEYYEGIAMEECVGVYNCIQQAKDESDNDFKTRREQLQCRRRQLFDRINEFDLYAENPQVKDNWSVSSCLVV